MLATGGLLVAIALLTLGAVAPIFRSSQPPRWTTRGWVGEVVTLVIVGTLALGVGCLGAGAIEAFPTGPDYLDLGLLAAVVLGAGLIWRTLKARARPRAREADAGVRVPVPESGDVPGGRAATAERAAVSANDPAPPHRAA
jgi:hypothetical protein